MMIGTINIVNNLNLAIQCGSQGCKVVYIGELENNLPPNFILCPMLLPPYQALDAEVNGDMALYNQIYTEYLDMTKECYDTIMTIVTSMFLGYNIIFYIENGEELNHMKFLENYFIMKFGIQLGTAVEMFMIYPPAYYRLYALAYDFVGSKYFDPNVVIMHNTLESLYNIPIVYPYAANLIPRLVNELGCNDLGKLHDYLTKFIIDDQKHNLVIREETS